MDRMTDEQAAGLLERIDTLTTKLNVTEEQADRTHQLANRLRVGFVVAFMLSIAAVIGALAIREQAQDIEVSRVQQCENGNNTRAGQRQIWTFFFEVTAASAKAQDTPQAVLDFYDAYVKWITDEVLPDRDCSDLSRKYAPAGPPPSYEEALREALEQERRDRG